MRTKSSRLEWQEVSPRWYKATGARGTYTIRHLGGGRWGLFGTGHDGLSMLSLPVSGLVFAAREGADVHADWLEQHGPVGEMSGS